MKVHRICYYVVFFSLAIVLSADAMVFFQAEQITGAVPGGSLTGSMKDQLRAILYDVDKVFLGGMSDSLGWARTSKRFWHTKDDSVNAIRFNDGKEVAESMDVEVVQLPHVFNSPHRGLQVIPVRTDEPNKSPLALVIEPDSLTLSVSNPFKSLSARLIYPGNKSFPIVPDDKDLGLEADETVVIDYNWIVSTDDFSRPDTAMIVGTYHHVKKEYILSGAFPIVDSVTVVLQDTVIVYIEPLCSDTIYFSSIVKGTKVAIARIVNDSSRHLAEHDTLIANGSQYRLLKPGSEYVFHFFVPKGGYIPDFQSYQTSKEGGNMDIIIGKPQRIIHIPKTAEFSLSALMGEGGGGLQGQIRRGWLGAGGTFDKCGTDFYGSLKIPINFLDPYINMGYRKERSKDQWESKGLFVSLDMQQKIWKDFFIGSQVGLKYMQTIWFEKNGYNLENTNNPFQLLETGANQPMVKKSDYELLIRLFGRIYF